MRIAIACCHSARLELILTQRTGVAGKYAVPDDNESNWLPWGYRKQAGDVYHVNSQTAEAIFFCVTSVSYLKPCNKIRISATTRKGQTCARTSSALWSSSLASPGKERRNVDSDETVCRDHGLDGIAGAVLCPLALAVRRSRAFFLLSRGRRSGIGFESAIAGHRRHHVSELPFHSSRCNGVESAGDAGHRLHRDPGAERVAGAEPAGSGQSPFQCIRNDGERQRVLLHQLPLAG